MEVALVVLVVLVVVLGSALVQSQSRAKRREHPHEAVEAGDASRGLTAPARPEEVQSADPEIERPREFVLEDASGRQLFAELIDPSESVLWRRADTVLTHQSSSVALDKVLDAVPVIGAAVKGGKVVRILNPEAFALGYQVKSKSGGFLGSIYGEKHVAAQLRFSKPEDVAKLATPLAVFKVASMVTGQYYLDRINGQLITIEGQVKQIRQELRNQTYGEITSAAEACMELEEGLSLSLDLTADERMRLVNAEGHIDKAYKQKLKDVQDFVDDVSKLFAMEKLDVGEVVRLLKEADSTGMYDMQLLAYGAAVRHKLNLLRAQVDLDAEGGRGALAQRKLDRELEAMRQDLLVAVEALAALGVTRDEAKERWKLKGWRKPPKLLDDFHPKGSAMREQLTQAPRTLLPTPTPTPMVLEAFVDERGLLQVLSATPGTEAESEAAAPASGPRLFSAPSGSVDRKLLRLKVLKDRRHELEKTGATDTLGAVADQVAALEAEIAALQGHGDHA
jgi:hypothetical protein